MVRSNLLARTAVTSTVGGPAWLAADAVEGCDELHATRAARQITPTMKPANLMLCPPFHRRSDWRGHRGQARRKLCWPHPAPRKRPKAEYPAWRWWQTTSRQ